MFTDSSVDPAVVDGGEEELSPVIAAAAPGQEPAMGADDKSGLSFNPIRSLFTFSVTRNGHQGIAIGGQSAVVLHFLQVSTTCNNKSLVNERN